MSNTIDLNAERNKRERPDAEFICWDPHGRPMGRFLYSYDFEGSGWSFELWAYDFEDAAARLTALRGSAKLDGQIHALVPA